ncbi:hypothetical protein LIS04_182 [Listeria phage LIS04]|nr:hypothetical protein LIS04_182 [Listeria phage LIS04]
MKVGRCKYMERHPYRTVVAEVTDPQTHGVVRVEFATNVEDHLIKQKAIEILYRAVTQSDTDNFDRITINSYDLVSKMSKSSTVSRLND